MLLGFVIRKEQAGKRESDDNLSEISLDRDLSDTMFN